MRLIIPSAAEMLLRLKSKQTAQEPVEAQLTQSASDIVTVTTSAFNSDQVAPISTQKQASLDLDEQAQPETQPESLPVLQPCGCDNEPVDSMETVEPDVTADPVFAAVPTGESEDNQVDMYLCCVAFDRLLSLIESGKPVSPLEVISARAAYHRGMAIVS